VIKGLNKLKKDFGVLHFDAHGDLRDTYEGSKYNHACVLRRISQLNLKIVSAGIRAISPEEVEFLKKTERIKLFYAHQMRENFNWLEEALTFLPEEIYVTFDVDFFDPSVIKATGTPEPGGFDWYYTLTALRKVFTSKRVLGMDIVEICPDPPYEVSTYTVAKLIYKLIAIWK